jgi:hypothetical protein
MDYLMIARELTRLTLLGLALASAAAQAVPSVPEKAGWGGYIGVGVGAGRSESNMLASIGPADLGDETVSGLNQSPDDEDIVLPGLNFEVSYTLADTRTQLYLGNAVADHLNFDLDTTLETHLGIRQEIDDIGTVDFSLAFSALPTDVWKDPYVVDKKRGDTERTSSGIHLVWGGILSTPLEFAWSAREIEVDDERSGQDGDLGLSAKQQRLLRRTGNVYRWDLTYDWKINERHRVVPGIGYLDYDLDGGAMAEDGMVLQLKHLYELQHWGLVSSIFYQDLESDRDNPIYGKQNQLETLGGSITAFYQEPFGLEHWTANAGVAYYEGDSNIDFYDSSFGLVSIGMLYRFD